MVITKEQLEELYIKQNLSTKEIVKLLKISRATLFNLFKEYDIEKPLEMIQSRKKQTNIKKYGCENPMQNKEIQEKVKKTIKRENVVEKRKQTCKERYGVDFVSQNKDIKTKIKISVEKAYSTGKPQEKIKQTFLKHYNTTNPFKLDKVKEKSYQTKKQNNTLLINNSKEEEQAYQLFLTKFDKEDIIRQYKSKLYPFKCDFYIKSLDLYIEYNGSHYHGRVPFDENNLIHQKVLQELLAKQPKRDEQLWHMIRVWTKDDPLKRETAKKNNLNWIEFWSLQEVEDWLIK